MLLRKPSWYLVEASGSLQLCDYELATVRLSPSRCLRYLFTAVPRSPLDLPSTGPNRSSCPLVIDLSR